MGSQRWRQVPPGFSGAALIVVLCLTLRGAAADVVGCIGFVQASEEVSQLRSASEPKVDYSSLTVEVQNSEGLVKEKAQCAPNGYFFVPVYDQGKYFVRARGPEGWALMPAKVEVVVDDKACNGGEPVNFFYTGFALSGRVLGSRGVGPTCEDGAPEGVLVTLSGADIKAPITASTRADGTYLFENLLPGVYELEASHPAWRVETLAAPKVELGWGGTAAADFFRVAGYDLSGSVVSQGAPVPGVSVFLFSRRLKKLATCPLGPGSPSPLPGRKPLCHAVTDEVGGFSFPELFCGEYELAAQYQGEFTAFEVVPEVLPVSVAHRSTRLTEPFVVLGFSIAGQVLDSVGAGVPGTQVYLDGKAAATTDAKGHYKLEKMTSGKYSLAAKKDHYVFANLSMVEVGPGVGALPPISARAYDVCAQVTLDDDTTFDRKRHVTLTHAAAGAGAAPQAKVTDEQGFVCFQVVPGTYELWPQLSPAEAEAGLLFEPKKLEVKVVARPLTLNLFHQAHLSISGVVECIEVCDERVNITLQFLGPPSWAAAPKAGAQAPPNPGNKSISLDPDANTFRFDRVPAGRYRVSVVHETREVEASKNGMTLDTDEWCWEGDGVADVSLESDSVEGLRIKQRGFRMVVNSTVVDEFYAAEQTGHLELTLQKGRNEFCLSQPGDYTLMFIKGCYFYGWFTLAWSTQVPYLILIDPVFYMVKGWVNVDSRNFQWANNLTDHAFLHLYNSDNERIAGTNYLHPERPANKSSPILGLEIRYYSSAEEEVWVEPHHDGSLNDNFRTVEDYQREMQEAEEKAKEQERQTLRDNGYTDERIASLEREKEEREKAGEEVGSLLFMAGLGHLAGAPSQVGEDTPEDGVSAQAALGMGAYDPDPDEEAAGPQMTAGVRLKVQRGGAEGAEGASEAGASSGEASPGEGSSGEGSGASSEVGAEGQAPEGEAQADSASGEESETPTEEEGEEEEATLEEEDEDEEEPYTEPVPEKEFPPPTRVLFYPKRRLVRVAPYVCPPRLEPFTGRVGVYLNGTISPPVSGVNVSVVADSDSAASGWRKGEVVEWGLSRDGEYIVGPLYDDATYHVELQKEGFIFRALDADKFEAQQLASIAVDLPGAPPVKPKGEPAAAYSVLLSLTGEKSFYRNSAVPPGQNFTFLGLYPGSYFLRPLLKEYEFEPASHHMELQSGEQRNVTFVARRVAFSVSGRVMSLLGKPEEGVTVEARTKEGGPTKHYETAVTDKKGRYRLRGLVPGVDYAIQVLIKGKAGGAEESRDHPEPRFERASPKTQDINLSSGDMADVDFVVFDRAPTLLTGTVSGPQVAKWQPNIRVEIVDHADRARVVQSSNLPISRFFEFKELPHGKYIVRLGFSQSERTHDFSAEEVEVDFRSEQVLHVGNLNFDVRLRQGSRGSQGCVIGADGTKQCKW